MKIKKQKSAVNLKWIEPENNRNAIIYCGKILEDSFNAFGTSPGCNPDYGFRRYDRKMVETLAKARVNSVLIYYSKGYGDRFEAEHRKNTGEFIKLCHKRKIRVILHFSFTGFYPTFLEDYPCATKWAQRESNHSMAYYDKHRVVCCPNQRAWLKILIKRCRAVISLGADGIFLDNISIKSAKNRCYCQECERLFKRQEGTLPPRGTPDYTDPLWQKFVRFRFDSVGKALKHVVKAVQKTKKDLVVFMNSPSGVGLGSLPRNVCNNTANAYKAGAIPYCEGGSSIPRVEKGGLIQNRDIYEAMLAEGRPALGLFYPPQHKNPGYPELLQTSIAEGWLAGGASSMCWRIERCDLFAEGKFIDAIKTYNSFQEKHPEIYRGLKEATTALYFSESTRNWTEKVLELKGMALLFYDRHYPFHFVTENSLDSLAGHELIILPEVLYFSAAERKAFEKRLKKGGKLLFTGGTLPSFSRNIIKRHPHQAFSLDKSVGTAYLESRANSPWEEIQAYLPPPPFNLKIHSARNVFSSVLRDTDGLRINFLNYNFMRPASNTRILIKGHPNFVSAESPENGRINFVTRQTDGMTEVMLGGFKIFCTVFMQHSVCKQKPSGSDSKMKCIRI